LSSERKLEKEGLFNPEHKKPIPAFPQKIGVVTSPTGAVIQDILNIITVGFVIFTSSCTPPGCKEKERLRKFAGESSISIPKQR